MSAAKCGRCVTECLECSSLSAHDCGSWPSNSALCSLLLSAAHPPQQFLQHLMLRSEDCGRWVWQLLLVRLLVYLTPSALFKVPFFSCLLCIRSLDVECTLNTNSIKIAWSNCPLRAIQSHPICGQFRFDLIKVQQTVLNFYSAVCALLCRKLLKVVATTKPALR